MYDLEPPAVYIHESVMAQERYRRRVNRVLAALKKPVAPVVYSDAELPDLIQNRGLLQTRGKPMGSLKDIPDPALLFNTFRFDRREQVAERAKAIEKDGFKLGTCRNALLGTGAFHWFDANLATDEHKDDKVCRPCWRIHFQEGCVHKCLYCGFGGLLISMVNVEDFCEHLGTLIERHPWQTTYLLDDDADPPCLEPELGCLGYLMEYFGTLKDRYLIIHTKTWNTAWMRQVKHHGNTIIVWSLSGPTQSRLIEPNTGTTEQRIEAARLAQETGIQIRYKFKPIIPVKTWREEAAYTVRLLFEKTKPDVISLCCFMWMEVEEMKKRLPVDLLDPVYLKAAEESREEVQDTLAKPFPHWVRAEIYDHYLSEIRRYSDVPVSLSTENWKMWGEFSKKLGMTPTNYVCGCGPQSTPGLRKLECHPFKAAVRHDESLSGVVG